MVYDVIVVGVGGMGSAALWQLARRGKRVLGLERFDIPHAHGSSHGISRIIRLPYYEHPSYVPLLHRAYELWREIEAASGHELLVITGSLDASPEDDPLFQGALASARLHGLDHAVLRGDEVNARATPVTLCPPTTARSISRWTAWSRPSARSSLMSRTRRRWVPTSARASRC